MYSLLVLGYLVFSTLPFSEVSAQTITIKSENEQSTTRGSVFTQPVIFTVSGVTQNNTYLLFTTSDGRSDAQISDAKTGTFKEFILYDAAENKDYTIYVKAHPESLYDTCKVVGSMVVNGAFQSVTFTGTITDVLYFSDGASTTRSVAENTVAETNIDNAVSATHWDSNVTLEYILGGTDKASFSINSGTGQLSTAAPMGPAGTTYSVTVKVKDEVEVIKGDGTKEKDVRSSDTIEVTINVINTSPPPTPQSPPPPGEINAGTTETLTIQRVNSRTVTLSWDIPTALNAQRITYRYSTNGGQTWTPTGSTNTSITITGDGFGDLTSDQFKIRAANTNDDGTRAFVIISARATQQQRRILLKPRECPLGWTRGSVFGNTKKALIYELKVEADPTNRTSIYQLKSVAIYVHPDENLETLDGWTLKVGTLYNTFGKELKLTAENSVIDEHNFAHIENPDETPIPMSTLGYIGQSLPSFDYRLYDGGGVRVDFGISCYKGGGLTWRLWNTADPRLLRVLPLAGGEESLSVQMENLNWQTPFFRSEWTAAVMPDLPDAPAAPSQMKGTMVGTWADLKKQ